MKNWKEYRLGDIISITGGFAYKGELIGSGDNYLLSMGCVSFSENFIDKGARQYAGDCPDRYYAKPGDIVLATRQQSDNLPILGMPAIIPTRYEGHKLIVGANLYRVNIKDDNFDSKFIYWLLKTPEYVNHIRFCQSGTTVRMITKGNIEDYVFYAPDKEVRDVIADFIWSIEEKIENNRKISDNLSQQSQALFKSWFIDFDPFRNKPFYESDMGLIPEGWKSGTLGDITSQSTLKVGADRVLKVLSPVTTGNLMLSEDYFTKQVYSESIAKYKIVPQDSFAYNPARINIGSIGRNEYDFDGCVSPVYVVFSCSTGYNNYFDLFRRTEKFVTEVKLRAIGGVRQSLNYKDFALIQTVIAPKEVLDKFNPIYEEIKAAQKHLEIENNKLSTLRDYLLPRLMSGEVEVQDIEKNL